MAAKRKPNIDYNKIVANDIDFKLYVVENIGKLNEDVKWLKIVVIYIFGPLTVGLLIALLKIIFG